MKYAPIGSIGDYAMESVRVYRAKPGEHVEDFRERIQGFARVIQEPVLGIHNDRYLAVAPREVTA